MDSWSDVEVISVDSDSHDYDSENVDDPAEQEIFSQQPADEEEQSEQEGHESENVDSETEVETQLEVLSQPSQHADPTSTSPPQHDRAFRPNRAAGPSYGVIDQTGSAAGDGSLPPSSRISPSRNVANSASLGFEAEYQELLECTLDDAGDGAGFPAEAVAELLLRHPQHWWCRYTDAMSELLLSMAGSVEGSWESAGQGVERSVRSVAAAASHAPTGVSLVWQEADAQLGACRQCLRAYHATKGRLRSRLMLDESDASPAEMERFMNTVLGRDRRRLRRAFHLAEEAVDAAHAASELAGSGVLGNGGGGSEAAKVDDSPRSLSLGVDATHAFWEVLSFADLLEDGDIEAALLGALAQVTRSGAECFSGAGWKRHWPGVLTLLVHRNASARAWAQFMTRRAGGIGAGVYREVLSPVIDRWSPILEQGLTVLPSGAADGGTSSSGGFAGEKERLHWSGLHVALQLLEPGAAPLLTAGFPTLVDLTLQKIDEGPGLGEGVVPLYLQVCGCLAALLRLLGPSLWDGSSLSPLQALAALERRCRMNEIATSGRSSMGSNNEAIRAKALEIIPLVVASSFAAESRGGDLLDVSGDSVAGLADSALKFLADELLALSSTAPVRVAGRDRTRGNGHRTVLTLALLDILEACYGSPSATTGADNWPWNSANSSVDDEEGVGPDRRSGRMFAVAESRTCQRMWWLRTWPVRSLKDWGPRLADAAGDREGYIRAAGSGGAHAAVIEKAAGVVELVLRRHVTAVWREALSALRGGRGPKVAVPRSAPGGVVEESFEMLPLCGPLLEQICLELPLLNFPNRVHAAVFEAHGSLSLLPCGEPALRSFGNGGAAANALANLHSGLISQFLKLFVPYVQGLTQAVKIHGTKVSPALNLEVAPGVFQAILAPFTAARSALHDLLSSSVCAGGSVEGPDSGRSIGRTKAGDWGWLFGRLPRECACAYFLAIPQALGAMAAAGPHLSLQSWGPLFQSAAVLGNSVLLPLPVSSDGGSRGSGRSGRCGSAGKEEEVEKQAERQDRLWAVLEAVWEFAFLQIIPEVLPALKEEHSDRLEESFRWFFDALKSLWPLLTGPVPLARRPSLTSAFLSSRALWLEPLLAWVSESWLTPRAREAAADFVQSSLLPTLAETSATAASVLAGDGNTYSSGDGGGGQGKRAGSPGKKFLRLAGGKLDGRFEEADEFRRELSDAELEAKTLRSLQSAVAVLSFPAATVRETALSLPQGTEDATRGISKTSEVNSLKSVETPQNVFASAAAGFAANSAARRTPPICAADDDIPWITRADKTAGKSRCAGSPQSAATTGVSPYFPVATTLRDVAAKPTSDSKLFSASSPYFASSSATGCGDDPPRSVIGSTADDWQAVSVGDAPKGEPQREVVVESRWIKRATRGGRVTDLSASSGKQGATRPRKPVTVTLSSAASDMENSTGINRVVTAAEAAPVRAGTSAALVSRKSAEAESRGSVKDKWREIQRRQHATATGTNATETVAAGQRVLSPSARVEGSSTKAPPWQTAASASAAAAAAAAASAANAAFAAQALATARRSENGVTAGDSGANRELHSAAALLDPASLAKAAAADLHRLVLSSWTVSELLAAGSDTSNRREQWSKSDGRGDGVGGGGYDKHQRRAARGAGSTQSSELEEGEILEVAIAKPVKDNHRERGGNTGLTSATLVSKLRLSKVPARFQSAEQYCDIFRGLLLEEIFATLVAGLHTGIRNHGGKGGAPPAASVSLRVTSFEERGEGGFSYVSMTADEDASAGGRGGGRSSHGFFNEDILLLKLVSADESVYGESSGVDTSACLAIFEKEPRGAVHEAAGAAARGRSSIRAKVYFPPTRNAASRITSAGVVPKKVVGTPHGDESAGAPSSVDGPSARILRAFRMAGISGDACWVRVARLEVLSTSTREFVALEGVSRVALLHHILQATPEPRFEALSQPSRRQQRQAPLRPVLGPPYPVDKASFDDACGRFIALAKFGGSQKLESAVRDGSLAFGDCTNGTGRGEVTAASTALLLSSVRSLASLRVTATLLHSSGLPAATRLKLLFSKPRLTTDSTECIEPEWGPEIQTSARRLFKCWRLIANACADTIGPKSSITNKQTAETEGGEGARAIPTAAPNGDGEDMEHPGHNATTSSSRRCGPSTAPPAPERPRLIPLPLWERLSREFNHSQLRAVWAAAASVRETHAERERQYASEKSAPSTFSKVVESLSAMPQAADDGEKIAGDGAAASRGGMRAGISEGGIVLLQGPPGTGKTRTILGIVSAILARGKEKLAEAAAARPGDGGDGGRGMTLEVKTTQKRPRVAKTWAAAKTHQRVLVCAPSNGAVDELTQRLALESGGVWDQRGKAFSPRVVRVGSPSDGAMDRVRAVTLDVMVEERVKLHPKSAAARDADTRIKKAYSRIEEAERDMRNGGSIGNPETRRHQLSTEIRRLRNEILTAKLVRRDSLKGVEVERGRIRHSLLSNAQVVCATLSGCGSAHLVEAVTSSGKGFDTVIIDEACQATELSTLIPLSLGCKRLILVGDPRQLPATVISQRAAKLNLEISLFERLENAGYPVHMLTVQYRMHPEIRAFPSVQFYEGRLTDAPCVQLRTNGSPSSSPSPAPPAPGLGPCFPPFLLVDVASGRERRLGSSYENAMEAVFVADMLARLVVDRRQRFGGTRMIGAAVLRVGVISPYRGQVLRILLDLGRRRLLPADGADNGNIDVEVSTVDGFQGKEVDIVLFSCVRAPTAGSEGGGGGIGFLKDRRRMNVAITRARQSLIVLGNAKRLASDRTWRALVKHADSRGSLVSGDDGPGGTTGGEALCARLEAMAKKGSGAEASNGHGTRDDSRETKLISRGNEEKEDRRGETRAGDEPRRRKIISGSRGEERQPSSSRKHKREACSRRHDCESQVKAERDDVLMLDQVPDVASNNSGKERASGKDQRRTGRQEARDQAVKGGKDEEAVSLDNGCHTGGKGLTVKRPAGSVESSTDARAGDGKRKRNESIAADDQQCSAKLARGIPRTAPSIRDISGELRKKSRSDDAAEKMGGRPTSGTANFSLAQLVGSRKSHVEGIASGREHERRQGLQGGKDECKRATKASLLGSARVTELGRSLDPTPPAPAAFAALRTQSASAKALPRPPDVLNRGCAAFDRSNSGTGGTRTVDSYAGAGRNSVLSTRRNTRDSGDNGTGGDAGRGQGRQGKAVDGATAVCKFSPSTGETIRRIPIDASGGRSRGSGGGKSSHPANLGRHSRDPYSSSKPSPSGVQGHGTSSKARQGRADGGVADRGFPRSNTVGDSTGYSAKDTIKPAHNGRKQFAGVDSSTVVGFTNQPHRKPNFSSQPVHADERNIFRKADNSAQGRRPIRPPNSGDVSSSVGPSKFLGSGARGTSPKPDLSGGKSSRGPTTKSAKAAAGGGGGKMSLLDSMLKGIDDTHF